MKIMVLFLIIQEPPHPLRGSLDSLVGASWADRFMG
jgi:hypothetical protein